MRGPITYLLVAWMALLGPGAGLGQAPTPAKASKVPDEVEEIMKEIRKAQEPFSERESDILKEIRKAYFAPSALQEEKILKDVRKAYLPTAEQETAILNEVRKAYYSPSAAKEESILLAIQKARAIPLGQIAPDSLTARADGMFRRLDQNGDALLNLDECPEALRRARGKWDRNADGFIDADEYRAYFQSRTQQVQEEQAALARQGNGGSQPPPAADPDEERKPTVYRAGNLPRELPSWFRQVDHDGDGQIGLYEWRTSRLAINEFQRLDRNDDGFLTIAEVLFALAGRANPNGLAQAPEAKGKGGKGPGH